MHKRLAKEVQDAYFDFDKSNLRPHARETLTRDAEALEAILSPVVNRPRRLQGAR
jgi:outer membrane protein OmpA-like peptidoglycan-associated protein